ncbi:hypothetical protein CDAR_89491 [Caerostris darwini]|uniref:Uncharacterized protein n=1 Tax=Caerostris darwini TaxID=1538125 RepID=A0AAV4N6E7_9ARAC|nr:hypothetical protein CDAR_89491 [Caerostris darwini]
MDFASSSWMITKQQRLKARQEEETISSKAGSSFKEMDFASSSWMITKNCDSVSKRDNPKKRQSQQSRIFIQRNGLCFLQLDDYQKL